MLSQATRALWRATEVLLRGMGRHRDLVRIILLYQWTLPEINSENRSSSPDGSAGTPVLQV